MVQTNRFLRGKKQSTRDEQEDNICDLCFQIMTRLTHYTLYHQAKCNIHMWTYLNSQIQSLQSDKDVKNVDRGY